MTDLADLKRRVEEAIGPDRELDAAIRAAFFGDMLFCDFETGSYHGECPSPGCGKPLGLHDERRSYPARWEEDDRLPPYTASLDATVALIERVKPGATWLVRQIGTGGGSDALVLARDGGIGREHVDGATPVLALLAALLSACEGGVK